MRMTIAPFSQLVLAVAASMFLGLLMASAVPAQTTGKATGKPAVRASAKRQTAKRKTTKKRTVSRGRSRSNTDSFSKAYKKYQDYQYVKIMGPITGPMYSSKW